MKRTLTLRAEALAELTDGELNGVVAARPESIATCPLFQCLNAFTNQGCADPTVRSC